MAQGLHRHIQMICNFLNKIERLVCHFQIRKTESHILLRPLCTKTISLVALM